MGVIYISKIIMNQYQKMLKFQSIQSSRMSERDDENFRHDMTGSIVILSLVHFRLFSSPEMKRRIN